MPEFDAKDDSLVKDTVDGVLGVYVLPSVANSEEGVIGLAFSVLFDGFNVPSGVEMDSSFPVTKENRYNSLAQDIGMFHFVRIWIHIKYFGYPIQFFPIRNSHPNSVCAESNLYLFLR